MWFKEESGCALNQRDLSLSKSHYPEPPYWFSEMLAWIFTLKCAFIYDGCNAVQLQWFMIEIPWRSLPRKEKFQDIWNKFKYEPIRCNFLLHGQGELFETNTKLLFVPSSETLFMLPHPDQRVHKVISFMKFSTENQPQWPCLFLLFVCVTPTPSFTFSCHV